MNDANIAKLIEVLEKTSEDWVDRDLLRSQEEGKFFDMTRVLLRDEETCSTAACICGWVHVIRTGSEGAADNFVGSHRTSYSYDVAARWLGISKSAAVALFEPSMMDLRSKREAIDVLQRLRTTGKVEWSIVPAHMHRDEIYV